MVDKGFRDFESLGLSSNIIRGCMLNDYKDPYPMHRKTIPFILSGDDVVVVAPTCSATTVSFLAPMLEKLNRHLHKGNAIRALILTPTRYLALQTLKLVRVLAQFTDLRIDLLVGDNEMESLFEQLTLQNPDVMIATPDSLMNHLSHVEDMLLHSVECVVFYEADCLLDLGFAEPLHQILSHINGSHQTLLFTNTLPSALREFVNSVSQDPHLVHHKLYNKISSTLKLMFFTLSQEEKNAALLYLIREQIPCNEKTLIFVPTRYHAKFLNLLFLDQGIVPSVCYGDMGKEACIVQVSRFRAGKSMLLITTDLASKGMGIPSVDNIINWDFPCSPEHFLFRVRVVARAGEPGTAFSFVTPQDIPYVLDFRIFLLKSMRAAPTEEQIMQDGNMLEVVSEIDEANASGETIYGCLPKTVVDLYVVRLREILDASAILKTLERSCAEALDLLI